MALEEKFDSERHISVEDVAVDSVKNPSLILFCLKLSKTDPSPNG